MIVPAQITDEERKRRLKRIRQVAVTLLLNTQDSKGRKQKTTRFQHEASRPVKII